MHHNIQEVAYTVQYMCTVATAQNAFDVSVTIKFYFLLSVLIIDVKIVSGSDDESRFFLSGMWLSE